MADDVILSVCVLCIDMWLIWSEDFDRRGRSISRVIRPATWWWRILGRSRMEPLRRVDRREIKRSTGGAVKWVKGKARKRKD